MTLVLSIPTFSKERWSMNWKNEVRWEFKKRLLVKNWSIFEPKNKFSSGKTNVKQNKLFHFTKKLNGIECVFTVKWNNLFCDFSGKVFNFEFNVYFRLPLNSFLARKVEAYSLNSPIQYASLSGLQQVVNFDACACDDSSWIFAYDLALEVDHLRQDTVRSQLRVLSSPFDFMMISRRSLKVGCDWKTTSKLCLRIESRLMRPACARSFKTQKQDPHSAEEDEN
jgi:hypothetical protein